MTSNWPDPDFQIKNAFVGRRNELLFLRKEVIEKNSAVVSINGFAGVGKTSLAMMFVEQNKQAFPGGIFQFHSTPVEPLDILIEKQGIPNNKPALFVVDDFDIKPSDIASSELKRVKNRFPNAKIIVTSRSPTDVKAFDSQLSLATLTQTEFSALLKARLKYFNEPDTYNVLFNALQGNPLAASFAASLINNEKITPRELIEQLNSFELSGILDEHGKQIFPESAKEKQIITDVASISDEFLKKLHLNPNLLYELTPRGFEELVAELLSRLDYEITLTPVSKDGGKDIYAAKKDHLGSFLYVVECKRYSPENPVGVGMIRQLNGVVQAEQATAGILATTSFFTKGAREFQKQISYQVSLKDYVGVQGWLKSVLH